MPKGIQTLPILTAAFTILACQLFSAPTSPGPPTEMRFRLPTETPAQTPSETPTANAGSSLSARQNADQPDEQSGYQVHVMYVLPSNGVDRELDTNGTLANSVGSFQNWLTQQTGEAQLRFDTFEGRLDISFYRLARSDATIASFREYVRDQVQNDLQAAGFNQPNKLYAVYYDGTSTWACGGGAWPPALIGNAAMLYLQGLPDSSFPCNANVFADSPTAPPGYLEFAMLHEIFHTLGAVAECAPHHILSGHVSDGNTDLMYAGSESWYPAELDIGRDDYWGHNATCVDLSDSIFMEPMPTTAVMPPGWK